MNTDKITEAVRELHKSGKMKLIVALDSRKFHNKSFLRIIYNKLILKIQRVIVPSHFKNFLLCTTGMHIGRNACIPHYITFDPYFPELICLGKGCIIGGLSSLKAHKREGRKMLLGKVIVEEKALVGGMVTIEPGSKISKNTIVASHTNLDTVTGEGELWAGKHGKKVKAFSQEELDKYFRPANGKYEEYYKEFRKKVKAFRKDHQQTFFKMHYDGNRDNPGNDWWRARNVVAIWWSGGLVELSQRMPWNWIRVLLFRLAGAHIGKDVFIGRGVVLDHLMTPSIIIEDNVRIDDGCYIDGHEYTIAQTVFGKTIIKNGAHLRKNVFVRTGTVVGENAVIEENAAIERLIPPHEVWAGSPAKFIKKC
jgi:acetyltransferase-like isoleucine patch superfamily enzyme